MGASDRSFSSDGVDTGVGGIGSPAFRSGAGTSASLATGAAMLLTGKSTRKVARSPCEVRAAKTLPAKATYVRLATRKEIHNLHSCQQAAKPRGTEVFMVS